MIPTHVQRLEKLRAKVAATEALIAKGLGKELKDLPARYGFTDAKALYRAMLAQEHPAKKRKLRAQMSTAIQAKVFDLKKRGFSYVEIAEKVGRHYTTIYRLFKNLAPETPAKTAAKGKPKKEKIWGRATDDEVRQIITLAENGHSRSQIAKMSGRAKSTISYILKKAGVAFKKAKPKPVATLH